MEYYCLMVKTDGEAVFQEDAGKEFSQSSPAPSFYFFKKKMRTSRGEIYEEHLFRGYVFMGIHQLSPLHIEKIKKCRNFYHFLNSNKDILRIQGQDLLYLENLMKFGETQGFSKVNYDINGKIRVISGPLTGFEGNIIRVNKKRQRVTVALDMFGETVKFDLGYDVIRNAQK